MNQTNSKPTLPLTVIIITNRDDKRLEKALDSVAELAQEILLIQNMIELSNKGSDQIEIIDYNQTIKDFSKVRNWALEHCQTDWALFIDSDEWLKNPTKAYQELKHAVNQSLFKAFTLTRQDTFLGKTLKHGEAGGQKHLRLVHKDYCQFQRPVHEVAKVKGMVGELGITIIHHSHLSIKGFLNSIGYYASLEADYRLDLISNQTLNNKRLRRLVKLRLIWELLTYPFAKFCLNYLLKLGFLDGLPGFTYALLMSFHSSLVRIYQLEELVK